MLVGWRLRGAYALQDQYPHTLTLILVSFKGLTGDLLNAARLDFDLVQDNAEELAVQRNRVQSLERTANLFQSRLRSVQLRRGRFAQKLLKSKMTAMKESLQDVFKNTDSSHQAKAKAVRAE